MFPTIFFRWFCPSTYIAWYFWKHGSVSQRTLCSKWSTPCCKNLVANSFDWWLFIVSKIYFPKTCWTHWNSCQKRQILVPGWSVGIDVSSEQKHTLSDCEFTLPYPRVGAIVLVYSPSSWNRPQHHKLVSTVLRLQCHCITKERSSGIVLRRQHFGFVICDLKDFANL